MDNIFETIKDGQNVFEYEDEQYGSVEECLKQDLVFFIFQLLLDVSKNEEQMLRASSLVDLGCWTVSDITSEVHDIMEESSIESLVLGMLIDVVTDLRLGRVDSIILTNFSDACDRITLNTLTEGYKLRNTNDFDSDLEDAKMKYSYMINALNNLSIVRQKDDRLPSDTSHEGIRQHMREMEKTAVSAKEFPRSSINCLLEEMPDLVDVHLTLNQQKIAELREIVNTHLEHFSQDAHVKTASAYEDPINFDKQIENFNDQIKEYTNVNGVVNIPFTIIRNTSFDAIKVLSYLKFKERIEFEWSNRNYWRIEFLQTPITAESLLGLAEIKSSPRNVVKTKYNLSFSEDPPHLLFRDSQGKETKVTIQGKVQKDVLRLIFKDPKNTYDLWSLEGIEEMFSDGSVGARAAKNAIYQFNNKVKLHLPDVDRLFHLTKFSAQIDPKYIQKN